MTRDRSGPARRSAAVHAVLRIVPLVAPVACAPGAPVRVELRKPSYRAEERMATCRAEGLVQLSIVMGR